jgi:hypothetical protein
MRFAKLVLMIVALSLAALAQPTAETNALPCTSAVQVAPAPMNAAERQKLEDSAMKFLEASDARHRLAEVLDKLLEDGRQSMMKKNPGLDPQFGDEWLKRMRTKVSLDQFVMLTAQVYEKYFTADELGELTQGQLAMKQGHLYGLTPQLADKLKSSSPHIQEDINRETSLLGGRMGAEVGKEIEKDHPEWINKLNATAPPAKKS